MTETTMNRRPLKTRDANIPKRIARWIAHKNITPNQISLLSIVFAMLAGFCMIEAIKGKSFSFLMPILTAIFIQCRLLCNLFDGMVAIEGGKSTKSGELFNDIPDRIADAIIFICAGYTITQFAWGPILGWLTALLAVMTAYVRVLCASMKAPMDFSGPMAKQHRMFTMTVACIAYAYELSLGQTQWVMPITLGLISLGCVLTLYRRTIHAYRYLENDHV